MTGRVSTAQALRDAMAAARPVHMAQDALVVEEASRVQLEALATRLEDAHARWLLAERGGGDDLAERDRRAVLDLVRAAAVYGYPRPPLEQLGKMAARVPGARTTDPSTSHDAEHDAAAIPNRTNQLGRILLGFYSLERTTNMLREAQGVRDPYAAAPYDAAMTSEEVATRVGIPLHAEHSKRCSVLLRLGFLRVALDEGGRERTRRGGSGRQRLAFELTDDGRAFAHRLAFPARER